MSLSKLKRKLAVLFAIHEKPVSSFLKSASGHVFVDVGANYGYYSMLLRGNFEKIYAFEPIPSIFKELESNLEKFDDAECIRKAVSNVDGQLVELSYYGSHGFADQLKTFELGAVRRDELRKMLVKQGGSCGSQKKLRLTLLRRNDQREMKIGMGFQYKPKLGVILAFLHGLSVGCTYIVTQGNLTTVVVVEAFVTAITAGLSYYKEKQQPCLNLRARC